ncbi:SLC13 family permease [Geoalkalibacter halelectricus]|uniref:DASS family sodium-coupled anion symporter n=1 Tax=Geoalkalibacter halelectricus TaxID=2847045 RepID=A0ABY5ZLN9_9BACT|nr:DASS family sodium-coupled anion symporter [Geoalkalibacter halelectricus]MDO3378709.1 DASS family sodium-coupled anion symporter [Geoalkalibacter halelectricus]UWZ79983.1 DASS family sodium-coupled anion symporter [Geoalkalibacter halelectricus]
MDPNQFKNPLKIDRRPMWVILAERTRRYQIIAALLILALLFFGLEPPAELSREGYRALVLFGACTFLWVSGLLPLAVTSLLALAAIPLLGILGRRETYALFGNEAVFFILSAFILAAAMSGSGLSARLARTMLARFGKTPGSLALTVFIFSALLSFAMSEHAVAAMMFAMVAEIVRSLGLEPGRSSYGKLLFMSIAWGCVIGGIATFLGGARAPLAVGMLREGTDLDFSFVEWTAAALPIVVPLLIVGFVLLRLLFPIDIATVEKGQAYLKQRRLEMGRMNHRELIVAVVMTVTILCWIFLGRTLGLANIAIVAVAVLFAFRVVSWKQIEEYVNWGVILMYGGAIALAASLERSGAARYLADLGLSGLTDSPLLVLAVFALLSLFLTECISNAAVIAMLMPIALSLEGSMGLDPRLMTLVIALPSGLAFCLPMGTPANAIVFSSGHLKMREMVLPGLLVQALALVLFLLTVRFVWPLMGFSLP